MTHPSDPPGGPWEAVRLVGPPAGQLWYVPPSDVDADIERDLIPGQMWLEQGSLAWGAWLREPPAEDPAVPTLVHYLRRRAVARPGALLKRLEAINDEADVLTIASQWGPLALCGCGPPPGQTSRWAQALHAAHEDVRPLRPGESLIVHKETVATWLDFRDRLSGLLAAASVTASGAITDDVRAGLARFGLSYADGSGGLAGAAAVAFNRSQVGSAVTELLRVGRVEWSFEWQGEEPSVVLDAPTLLGRLALGRCSLSGRGRSGIPVLRRMRGTLRVRTAAGLLRGLRSPESLA